MGFKMYRLYRGYFKCVLKSLLRSAVATKLSPFFVGNETEGVNDRGWS